MWRPLISRPVAPSMGRLGLTHSIRHPIPPFACFIRHHSSPTNPRKQAHNALLTTYTLDHHLPNETLHPSPDENSPPASLTLEKPPSPLSHLTLISLLRSYLVTSLTSSPVLLPLSLRLTKYLANSPCLLEFPPISWLIKRTFYAHFCAGSTPVEVSRTICNLKRVGFAGVILAYARETVLDRPGIQRLANSSKAATRVGAAEAEQQLALWRDGTLETIRLTPPEDFIAIHFTGAGPSAVQCLLESRPPTKSIESAMHAICSLAQQRGVRLMIDAEQTPVQPGIDSWALSLARKYNSDWAKPAVVWTTYQAYLKSAPETLARHLAVSEKEGWRLGAKLVRGAYLASDPRGLIHDTKADTDAAYDSMVAGLITRRGVDVVIASHNRTSVRKARRLVEQRGERAGGEVIYAQLMGMADEVGGELIDSEGGGKRPKGYKYLVWGSVEECMKYLLRRAEENRDALGRTRDGRREAAREVGRRVRSFFEILRW